MSHETTQGGDVETTTPPLSRHDEHRPDERKATIHEDPDSEVPEGYQRFVHTYDNGLPVTWIDVPDGMNPPETIFLCTEAAYIYMMDDQEFDRYEAYLERDPYRSHHAYVRNITVRAALIASLSLGVLVLIGTITTSTTSAATNPTLIAIAIALMCPSAILTARRCLTQKSASNLARREDDLKRRLKRFAETTQAESLAEAAFRQLNAIRDLRKSTQSAIDANFKPRTITNMRFSSTLADTCDSMFDNIEAIVTKMEIICPTLDGDLRNVTDRRQKIRKRRHAYDTLATDVMRALESNEKIMADVDSLRQELLSLYAHESDDRTNDSSTRIRELTVQTKLYAKPTTSTTKAD